MRSFENKIIDLESQLTWFDDTQIRDDINQSKETLNDLVKKKNPGAIAFQEHSGAKKVREILVNLEKRNSNLRSINRLELEKSTTTEDPTLILHEMIFFTDHYIKATMSKMQRYI